jgi:predicted RNA-binding Zn-ribbon protein involved in translation (DUF1610 family)
MLTDTTPSNLAHMTPTGCPRCGGKAPIKTLSPDAFDRNPAKEAWVFECEECGYRFGRIVEK